MSNTTSRWSTSVARWPLGWYRWRARAGAHEEAGWMHADEAAVNAHAVIVGQRLARTAAAPPAETLKAGATISGLDRRWNSDGAWAFALGVMFGATSPTAQARPVLVAVAVGLFSWAYLTGWDHARARLVRRGFTAKAAYYVCLGVSAALVLTVSALLR